MTTNYETDFVEWAEEMAQLLRSGRFAELDVENVAEEIEALGKRDRRSVNNRLARLIQHLLKWRFQPHKRTRSWRDTIFNQRENIRLLLRESPSLRHGAEQGVPEQYARAVRLAAEETLISGKKFPSVCPWTLEELLDQDFLPEDE